MSETENDRNNNGCDVVMGQIAPGVYGPSAPLQVSGRLQRRRERRCRHHWHADHHSMTAWFCCNCGADRDGQPVDGFDRGWVARAARWRSTPREVRAQRRRIRKLERSELES